MSYANPDVMRRAGEELLDRQRGLVLVGHSYEEARRLARVERPDLLHVASALPAGPSATTGRDRPDRHAQRRNPAWAAAIAAASSPSRGLPNSKVPE